MGDLHIQSVGSAGTGSIIALPDAEALTAQELVVDNLRDKGIIAFGNGAETRALNLLRGQLMKRCASEGYNLIGVTSAEPDAGKSFVTINLAAALSRIEGQRVVLFDLDLKRPTAARRFGLNVEHGLESWLAGDTDHLAHVGRRLASTRLSIFPVIDQRSDSSDLLANPRFEALVEALRRLPKSTIVLCDLPPAFVSDDALTVVGKLDAYIHVIDEGVTPRRQAQELRTMMDPTPCLGAVLNRYAGRWNDSYGYAAARKYARYYDPER